MRQWSSGMTRAPQARSPGSNPGCRTSPLSKKRKGGEEEEEKRREEKEKEEGEKRGDSHGFREAGVSASA